MSLSKRSMNGNKDISTETQSTDLASRLNMATNSITKNMKGIDNLNDFQDQEAVELYSQARAKENEIMFLREQIALASIKESELLNEKHSLERKFSELRLALDEKQNESIISASNELARRKGDLEENLRLVNELKDTSWRREYIVLEHLLKEEQSKFHSEKLKFALKSG